MNLRFFIKEGLKQCYLPLAVTFGKHANSLFPLIPFRPASGNIMVTHNCNSRCLICSMWKNRSSEELNTIQIYDVLRQLKEVGIRRVCFSGGEPPLRRDLPHLVQKAHELGFEKVQILTNGLLLNRRMAKELLDNGLDRVSISIDGPEDVHDIQRGIKGAYQRTMSALKSLVELRGRDFPNLDIEVLTTLTRLTTNHIHEVIKICKNLNVSWMISVFEISSLQFKGVDSSFALRDQEKIEETINRLHFLMKDHPISIIVSHIGLECIKYYLKGKYISGFQRKIPCTAGFTAIYIDAYGNLYPGCWAQPAIGNLRKEKLKEIVNMTSYRRKLKQMFLKQTPACPCPNGYIWSIWYYLPAIFKEALWRLRMFFITH